MNYSTSPCATGVYVSEGLNCVVNLEASTVSGVYTHIERSVYIEHLVDTCTKKYRNALYV